MSKVGVATKKELQDAKEELDDIFYSSEFIMGSLPKLWDVAKQKTKIPFRVVKGYYDNQAIVQIFKPLKKPFADFRITTDEPFNVVFMDTMILDKLYVINVIDLFSKYASSSVFRKPVSSADAVKALKEFLEEANISLDDIGEIRCDGGPEFQKDFLDFVGEKKVTSLPSAKTEMSPVERFNGTLRRMVEKLKAFQGVQIDSVPKYIKKAVDAYNSLKHSTTGYSPRVLIKDEPRRLGEATSLEDAISDVQSKIRKGGKPAPDRGIFQGATVRVALRDYNAIIPQKIAPNWSSDLFKVTQYRNNRVTLNDGRVLKGHQVLPVNPELLMNKKVNIESAEQQREKRNTRNTERELRKLGNPEILPEPRKRIPKRADT